MKRAFAVKRTNRSAKEQTAPPLRLSSDMPCSDACFIDTGLKKEGLTKNERSDWDMAPLRKYATKLAFRRRLSTKPLRTRDVEAPIQQIVQSLEDPLAAVRKGLTENDRWERNMATLRKAATELAFRRKQSTEPARKRDVEAPIQQIVQSLGDASAAVRMISVRALYDLDPERAASLFNIALRESSPEQRREIGAAIVSSGVVDEAINNLMEGNRENCYGEFSLLFLVAKSGEVQPLIRLIEKHPNMDLRLALVRLLASSGGPEVLSAFGRLALSGSLATGVRLALLEAINQITSQTSETTSAV